MNTSIKIKKENMYFWTRLERLVFTFIFSNMC